MTQPTEADPPQTGSAGSRTKFLLIAVVAAAAGGLYIQLGDRLSLDYLATQETTLRQFHQDSPALVYGAAFLIYVVVTGLSLPGAAAMTLIMGWYFGFVRALILVSFASTLGATLAFLLSRFVLRDTIQAKFGDRLESFNAALDREGAFYLFTLRLIPAVPFFVINVVMGLTRVKTWTFWWVSQIGMLAGTMVFVYAGSTIPSLAQLADPSQLRPGDVRDWPALIETIGPNATSPTPGNAIRSQLDAPTRDLVDQLAGSTSSITPESSLQLLNGLNTALVKPDFALQPAWSSFQSSAGEDNLAITSLNRSVLVAALPAVISAPRPILSKQLLLAFVLLGTFPIIAKRLMARLVPKQND